MELKNKVAIVTGGAVRVGRALALALAQQGVRVALHYGSSAEQAEEVVSEIQMLGGEAIALQADLSQMDQLPALVKRVTAHFGPVDILVNNAAIFEPGDVFQTTERDWDRHFAINLKAPFFLSQAFATQIGPERSGHIVNISDWRATRPAATYIAYTLTKAALNTMTQSLALALAPNIQVNALALGAILPPPGQGPDYLAMRAQSIPAKHAGKPADVADALMFLLRSDFVTGDVIFVTGGQHL